MHSLPQRRVRGQKKGADTDDDFCNICWVDPLRAAPCVSLECGHLFHFMCLWQKIDRKWPAARITFGFLNCPLCKQEIHHPALDDITNKYYALKAEIQKDAVEHVKIEGLHKDKRMTDKDSQYYKNMPKFAMDRLAFYPCSKCKKPYFGGMKACEEAGLEQAENFKEEHLVRGWCAARAPAGPTPRAARSTAKSTSPTSASSAAMSARGSAGAPPICDQCHKESALMHNLADTVSKLVQGDFTVAGTHNNLISPTRRFSVASSSESPPLGEHVVDDADMDTDDDEYDDLEYDEDGDVSMASK